MVNHRATIRTNYRRVSRKRVGWAASSANSVGSNRAAASRAAVILLSSSINSRDILSKGMVDIRSRAAIYRKDILHTDTLHKAIRNKVTDTALTQAMAHRRELSTNSSRNGNMAWDRPEELRSGWEEVSWVARCLPMPLTVVTVEETMEVITEEVTMEVVATSECIQLLAMEVLCWLAIDIFVSLIVAGHACSV